MFLSASLWNDLMVLVGEVTVILIFGMFVGSVLVMIVAGLSIQSEQFYFPRLMKSGMVLLEGMIRGISKFFGFDDTDLIQFSIRLQNTMNTKKFAETPVEKRVIYLPTSPPKASSAGGAAGARSAGRSTATRRWATGSSSHPAPPSSRG